jgi:type II restriction enzyme
MLKGNKGEWSEIYVLLRLLADGKIYAADEDLNKLEKIYFPILKIIREEVLGEIIEYKTGEQIEIYINGELYKSMSKIEFETEAVALLENIRMSKESAFQIERTEGFMKDICCCKMKSSSQKKKDISMQIIDINTGHSPIVGFSIKSELGSSPTLLNAGKTTNFVFRLEPHNEYLLGETNGIYLSKRGKEHSDIRGRIQHIISNGSTIVYKDMINSTFKNNLILIDSAMDKIIAQTLLYYYRDNITKCSEIVNKLKDDNPMGYVNKNAYTYKFKKFLTSIALGMKPGSEWDGQDEANGGYIVVSRTGDVLAYHIYNRNYFEEYLLNNTKYETPSTTRHDFGSIYTIDNQDYFNLNLQVRFM